jgi:Glycosyl hydrolase catalytic core
MTERWPRLWTDITIPAPCGLTITAVVKAGRVAEGISHPSLRRVVAGDRWGAPPETTGDFPMSSPFTAASDPSWSDGLLSLLLSTDTFEGFLHELTVLTVGTSALIDFSKGVRFPTDAQQAAFVTASTKMPASLPYVQRYAWFGLPASDTEPNSGLFHSNGVATPAGRAFQAAV